MVELRSGTVIAGDNPTRTPNKEVVNHQKGINKKELV
jgi:hypothetical protein